MHDLSLTAADDRQRTKLLHRRPHCAVIHQVGEHPALFRLDKLPQRPCRHSHRFAGTLGDDGTLVEHFALDAGNAGLAEELVPVEKFDSRQVDAADVLERTEVHALDLELGEALVFEYAVEHPRRFLGPGPDERNIIVGKECAVTRAAIARTADLQITLTR